MVTNVQYAHGVNVERIGMEELALNNLIYFLGSVQGQLMLSRESDRDYLFRLEKDLERQIAEIRGEK